MLLFSKNQKPTSPKLKSKGVGVYAGKLGKAEVRSKNSNKCGWLTKCLQKNPRISLQKKVQGAPINTEIIKICKRQKYISHFFYLKVKSPSLGREAHIWPHRNGVQLAIFGSALWHGFGGICYALGYKRGLGLYFSDPSPWGCNQSLLMRTGRQLISYVSSMRRKKRGVKGYVKRG